MLEIVGDARVRTIVGAGFHNHGTINGRMGMVFIHIYLTSIGKDEFRNLQRFRDIDGLLNGTGGKEGRERCGCRHHQEMTEKHKQSGLQDNFKNKVFLLYLKKIYKKHTR